MSSIPRSTRLGARIAALFLAGCTMPGAGELFERHEVVLGPAEGLSVLTGAFLDGPFADLAVVEIDPDGRRRLRLFAFRGGRWAPALEATLRSDVAFVDVARIDGRDRLIAYGAGRLSWFDPGSATERDLAAVRCDYAPSHEGHEGHEGEIPHVDVTHDLNGDGRDDLVVPDGHGFGVLVQTGDGGFAGPVAVGPATGAERVYRVDGYRHDPWASGRVHRIDYDRDGRDDLAYWDGDRFAVHLQDGRGRFAPTPRTFTTEVPFDSDELASLAAPGEARHRRKDHGLGGELTGRVLHSLRDVDGDGIGDLVVFSLEGGSLWRMGFRYEVHFGAPSPDGGTVFAREAGASIVSDGIPFGVEQHDFDGDGQLDVMFTKIEPGILMAVGAIVRSVVTGYVSADLELYRMEGGTYGDEPDTTRRIKTFARGEPGAKFPSVLVSDVDGDGRADLLVQSGRRQLRVHVGEPGPELFARRSRKMSVPMPRNEEYTWMADLDRDGRRDLLLHHAPHASGGEPHRLTLLLVR